MSELLWIFSNFIFTQEKVFWTFLPLLQTFAIEKLNVFSFTYFSENNKVNEETDKLPLLLRIL